MFGNIVDLWGGANPRFFDGTAVGEAARQHLAKGQADSRRR